MTAYISKGTAMLCFAKFLANNLPTGCEGFVPTAIKQFESILHETPSANVIEADSLFEKGENDGKA